MPASVLTLYCANPEQSSSSAGLLTPTQPGASTSTTGWIQGQLAAGNYSRQSFRQEKAVATFTTTAQPSGTPVGLAQDCWRISAQTTGDFSAGTWYSSLSVIAVTSGGFHDGRANFRLYRSTDPACSGSSTDDFNRANAADRGATWTSVSGSRTALDTNESEGNNAGDPALEYYNVFTPNAAQFAKITLRAPIETGSGAGCGPAIRIQTGADTGYITKCNTVAAQRFQVYRRVAGADGTAIMGYTGAAPAAGDVVELRVNGSFDLELYVNDVQRASFTDTDANRIAAGRVGDFGLIINDFIRWDDWEGGSLSVVTELTAGRMVGTTVTNLSTSVAQSSSASTQIGAFSLANEYLFLQTAWESV